MNELHSNVASILTGHYTEYAAHIRELAAPLTNAQFWQKPFPFGNSFGHLVLHLTGNLNYYIGTQIAKTGYVRNRPLEFTDSNPPSKDEALKRLDDAVAMVIATIRAQSQEEWSKAYSGEGVTAQNRLDIVMQCASHMQLHIGQMIYLVFQLRKQKKD